MLSITRSSTTNILLLMKMHGLWSISVLTAYMSIHFYYLTGNCKSKLTSCPNFFFILNRCKRTPFSTTMDSAEGWDVHSVLGAQRAPVLHCVGTHKIYLNPWRKHGRVYYITKKCQTFLKQMFRAKNMSLSFYCTCVFSESETNV